MKNNHINSSLISCFKQCRRKAYLRYIEQIYPKKDSLALEMGRNYHQKLDDLFKKGYVDNTYDKESAMALAFAKYIYPYLGKVESSEERFEIPFGKYLLTGILDARKPNGMCIEHKTTSAEIGEDYIFKLRFDEQIPIYMLAIGINEMLYTVCRKPTIRIKKNETEEEYFYRCCEWYDDNTESKIKLIKVTRTKAELEQALEDLKKMADEIHNCNHWYKNPTACMSWGSMCPYATICLDYDPNLKYIEFIKKGDDKNVKSSKF